MWRCNLSLENENKSRIILHFAHLFVSLQASNKKDTMKKTYLKGYQTKELIAALDMAVIRHKNKDMLSELETALGALASER